MIKINGIKVLTDEIQDEQIRKKIKKKLRLKEKFNYQIYKRSIDARGKPEIYYVYEVLVELNNEKKYKDKKDVSIYEEEKYEIKNFGDKDLKNRPVIVGSGPAGLFCAYMLSYYGYKPIIIERGKDLEERVKDVENFWKDNKLNTESNVQFGLGGAGTFSDGKLNTLVKDKRHIGRKVFEIFVDCGAPKEILYLNKPHIGTDLLRKVIKNLKEKIEILGGKFLFSTKLTDIKYEGNKVKQIEVNHKELIDCEILVLALGHSARDTFEMLVNKIKMKSKPFAVGLRISHSQDMINESQYGNNKNLPPADYKLTCATKNNRGVYSFCMCPGGYVVNASSEEKRLVVNGMSNYKRDSKNANSAIVVTVSEDDYGTNLLDGMYFQRKLEEKAYKLGNGNIPIQLYKDFKLDKVTKELGKVKPIFKGNYTLTNLQELFSKDISNSLIEGIEYFGTKIKGFNRDDAILAGVESRTSSPIRILRDEKYETNIKGIYPCGEGAGYAGGITTASIDGIKVAEEIIKIYKNS